MTTQIGTLAVRRSILIGASPERVWQEFETFERLRTWFGTGHELLEYEPRQGGHIELRVDVDGETHHFGGRVLGYDPPRELTFEDDWIPSRWPAATLITFRLSAALDGTLVEFFHHAIERIGPEAAKQHRGWEGGWTMRQLEALRVAIEG